MSVDIINNKDNFGTLVLFSGDSDFEYLIKNLSKVGKHIICLSHRGNMSEELFKVLESVNGYYSDINKFKNTFITLKKRKTPST